MSERIPTTRYLYYVRMGHRTEAVEAFEPSDRLARGRALLFAQANPGQLATIRYVGPITRYEEVDRLRYLAKFDDEVGRWCRDRLAEAGL